MGAKFKNNAVSTIADVGGIASGDLALTVASGDGNTYFPAAGGDDYFYCTLVDSSGNREIIKVTSRTADACTIVRAQEGTIARAFAKDDVVEVRLTAGVVEAMADNALDSKIAAFVGLTGAANKLAYFTGAEAMSVADLTAFARTLLDNADAAAVLTTLGLTAFVQTLINDADAATFRATIGAPSVADATALPRSYLAGLQLFNDTDADHDIGINVGECRDSADGCDLILSAILTKQIDAAFAVGDDAGGMFTGSVANSTEYHIFLIKKDSDETIDAGFDTDVDCANIPSGYTEYRRLGSRWTDGSANLRGSTQIGDDVLWDDPPLDVNESSVDQTSAALKTLTVATGVKVKAIINVYGDISDGEFIYISSPDVNDEAPSTTAAPLCSSHSGGPGTDFVSLQMEVWTNTSGQVRVRGSNSNASTFLISALGYTDRRGRDG